MNDTGVRQPGCVCAQEYADQWPDMTPAELAHVHAPTCPVRLWRQKQERRRAREGGAAAWEALLRQRRRCP